MSYRNVSHKIWLIPLQTETLALGGLAQGFGLKDGKGLTPLIYVTEVAGKLEARNKDLNPIGLKRNLRQHFGTHSKKFTIRGFVSPLAETSSGFRDSLASDGSVARLLTTSKILFLKNALLNQHKFLIVGNNDYDIFTIDSLEDKESEDEPYVYDIVIQATSLRLYDGYNNYLQQLGSDVVINTLVQNLLPTLVFRATQDSG